MDLPLVQRALPGEQGTTTSRPAAPAVVRVPDSWFAWVSPDDARALGRMLFRAADEAEGG